MTRKPLQRQPLPGGLEALFPRQRDLAWLIYMRGGATISEIFGNIPEAPSTATGLRTLLRRMVRKGILGCRASGRHKERFYFLRLASPEVQINAFDRIVREHFGGSRAAAMSALEELARTEISETVERVARPSQ